MFILVVGERFEVVTLVVGEERGGFHNNSRKGT